MGVGEASSGGVALVLVDWIDFLIGVLVGVGFGILVGEPTTGIDVEYSWASLGGVGFAMGVEMKAPVKVSTGLIAEIANTERPCDFASKITVSSVLLMICVGKACHVSVYRKSITLSGSCSFATSHFLSTEKFKVASLTLVESSPRKFT